MQASNPGQQHAAAVNGAVPAAGQAGEATPPLTLPPAAERALPRAAPDPAAQPGAAVPAAALPTTNTHAVSEAASAAAAGTPESAGQRRLTRASSRAAPPPSGLIGEQAGGSEGPSAEAGDRPPAVQDVKRRLTALGATYLFDKVRERLGLQGGVCVRYSTSCRAGCLNKSSAAAALRCRQQQTKGGDACAHHPSTGAQQHGCGGRPPSGRQGGRPQGA